MKPLSAAMQMVSLGIWDSFSEPAISPYTHPSTSGQPSGVRAAKRAAKKRRNVRARSKK